MSAAQEQRLELACWWIASGGGVGVQSALGGALGGSEGGEQMG